MAKRIANRQALTVREQQIATLQQQGLSYGQIAEQLGISVSTVSSHMDSVHKRLRRNNVSHYDEVAR